MTDQPRREALSDEARRAAEATRALETRLGERRSTPLRPGDLFVHPVTAEYAVEWLVLNQAEGGELVLVPADTYPPVGSADIEIPPGEPNGPLNLRCGYGVRLPAASLTAAERSGEVGSEALERAREKHQRMNAGTLVGDPLEREVDSDPEYRDWLAEVVAPARESFAALATGDQGRRQVSPSSTGRSRLPWAVAAALAAALLGLSLWTLLQSRQNQALADANLHLDRRVQELAESYADLQHQIDLWAERPDRPFLLGGYAEVPLGERTRSGGSYEIPAPEKESGMLLLILFDEEIPFREAYRVEISAPELDLSWRSPAAGVSPSGELLVTLPPSMLAGNRLRLKLFGEAEGELELLQETTLELRREPRP